MSDENNDSIDEIANDARAAIEQLSGGNGYDGPSHEEQHAIRTGEQIAEQLDAQDDRRNPELIEGSSPRRDGRGRFAPRVQAEPATQQEPQAVEPQQQQQQAVVDANTPPTSWSREAKASWQALPEHTRQAIAKREQEISDGFRQYGERVRQHEAIENLIAPRRAQYQRFGFNSDAEAINQLLLVSDGLERNAAATIRGLADHFRLGPEQLGYGGGQQQQVSPQQAQEYIGMGHAQAIVQAFEADPKNVYYQTVKPVMQQLLMNGQADDIKDAYDKACQMHPGVLQVEQRRAQEQHRSKAIRASNASLNGPPHGAQNGSRPASKGQGHFGEVAADVRAAINQLS